MNEVKTLNGLMKHLRDKHNISIGNSSQKQKLRNIGYYHGFKGYRYILTPNNKIQYRDFEEIMAINNFDMKLKTLFYPKIMFIETALKNYVLEVITEESGSSSVGKIYETLLTDYKSCSIGSRNYKEKMKKRLEIRNTIYKTLAFNYSKGVKTVTHFYDTEKSVPIWAVFENINLGDFGNFVSCLNSDCRRKIECLLGINIALDSGFKLLERIVFILKDLRNAIAHNNVIFDTRFKRSNSAIQITNYIESEVNINNVLFTSIVDYVILVAIVLKLMKVSKREINKFILEFEQIQDDFYKSNPNIYISLIPTDTNNKVINLKNFI